MAGRALDYDAVERVRLMISEQDHGSITLAPGSMLRWNTKAIWIDAARSATHEAIPITFLNTPGVCMIPEVGLRVAVEKSVGFKRHRHRIGRLPCVAYVRRSGDNDEFGLRSRREGDRIEPTGMTGSISIKKLLINLKIPADMRTQIPLIVSGDDVVYVAGYRIDRRWAVPSRDAPSWKIVITKEKRRA